MNLNQAEYAAQIFRQSCAGVKMTPREREFLQGLLDKMNDSEKAGVIASMIKIMLKENV